MTRERAKELLPVIRAFSEGKVIQFKPKSDSNWHALPSGDGIGLWDNYDYRVKPEPREWWLVREPQCTFEVSYLAPDAHRRPEGTEFVRVREVLDEPNT